MSWNILYTNQMKSPKLYMNTLMILAPTEKKNIIIIKKCVKHVVQVNKVDE